MQYGETLQGLVRGGLGAVGLAGLLAACSASGGSFANDDAGIGAVDSGPAVEAGEGSDASTDVSTDTGPACPGQQTQCAGDGGGPYCANTKSDNANCGACGTVCADGLVCGGGACVVSCPGTEVNCGGSCIQPATDNVHCGAEPGCGGGDGGTDGGGVGAGVACGPGAACVGGACIPSCLSPLIICGSACIDPRVDPLHCGDCTPCAAVANATNPACSASSCVTGTCNAGFNDCNGTYGDGCESNAKTDNANCGLCGHACTGGLTCFNGNCESSTLFFDSLTGSGSSSSRGAGDSCGTNINVTTTQTFTGIAVKNNLSTAGNIRFMVWTVPAHVLVYVSPAKAFGTGDSWKQSDLLALSLTAGQSYDIGGISDVAGTWDYDTTIESSFGIASTITNPNFLNFTTPVDTGGGGADCGIRLFR